MKKNSLTTAVVAGIAGVAGFAGLANAVHLNPDGLGQVLLYPYYTVNAGQQTLLSVVNTSDTATAVKVRFLEGYNTREVLDFNLFLSPYDVWTATVFSLRDAGKDDDGAAILTRDKSCTAPAFVESGLSLDDGTPYVPFVNYAYADGNADGGPEDISRTREGHFEIIAMADLGAPYAGWVTHNGNGVPANCPGVRDLSSVPDTWTPSGGLFGGAAVLNGSAGTFYSYNADALDQFTNVALFTDSGQVTPNLNSVNDDFLGGTATAHVFTSGGVTTSEYNNPGAVVATRPIDAVSAIFAADAIYNEYQTDASIKASSDWVVTFPTKSFYVDELVNTTVDTAPFAEWFSSVRDGQSCVTIGLNLYDREEQTTQGQGTGFSPPPPGAPPSALCREVNVISFLNVSTAPTSSPVLGSTLVTNVKPSVGAAGWLKLNLNPGSQPHLMRAAYNGNVWRGLPVTGFWAQNLVNNDATEVNGVSTLSNYSGVFRHRSSRDCINAGLACS